MFRLALLVMLWACGGASVCGAETKPVPPPALGASLANVRLFDLSGRRHDMSDVDSRCVVVVFWAFWCDTWKKALPQLKALDAESGALGCRVWTVSVDGRWAEQIRPLLAARRVPFPVLVDDGELGRRLGIRRVPTVLVLDRQRRIVWLREGYPGNAAIERIVRGVRGEDRPAIRRKEGQRAPVRPRRP